jgi:hypothetical protein
MYKTLSANPLTQDTPITFDAKTAGIYHLYIKVNFTCLTIFTGSVTITFDNEKEHIERPLSTTVRMADAPLYVQFDDSKITVSLSANANIDCTVTLDKRSEHFHDMIIENVPTEKQNTKHLLFTCHGLLGVADDLYYNGEYLRHLLKNHVDTYVLYSRANELIKTTEGIERCGQRAYEELKEFITRYFTPDEKIYFSILGHSFGGLIARECIKNIFEDEQLQEMLIPVSYTSISSPHLGIRRCTDHFLGSAVQFGFNTVVDNAIGKTGKELNLSDDEQDPILLRMSRPGSSHIQALERFKHKMLTGTTYFDGIVPHASSLIVSYTMGDVPMHGKTSYKVIEYSGFNRSHADLFSIPEVVFHDPVHEKTDLKEHFPDSQNLIVIHYEMLKNMQQIPWRRVHAQFSMQNVSHVWSSCAHILVINRQTGIASPARDHESSTQYCQLISQIIAMDHLSEIKQSQV